ncbi:hypothetical protein KUTeg_009569, partial [Tegillarca granosa]
MVKRCQWGLCNSDTRYPERLEGGVRFILFPKPRRNKEKCLRWIKLCGRLHEQLNVHIVDGNRHLFVCTKHFVEGEPTACFPDPVPAIVNGPESTTHHTPARKPPTRRALSEPAKKRRKVLDNITSLENTPEVEVPLSENDIDLSSLKTSSVENVSTQEFSGYLALDMLALTAENQQLKEQVARLILENENLKREQGHQQEALPERRVSFLCRRDSFVYYTGFKFERFMDIFNFLVEDEKELPFIYSKSAKSLKTMPLQDQLLLTLMKLRQNFDYKHMAYLFMISPQDEDKCQQQMLPRQKIAIYRVRVENAIARIKDFKILAFRLDLSLFANINQI